MLGPPTAHLDPPGGAKTLCFYTFCCIWAPWGSRDLLFFYDSIVFSQCWSYFLVFCCAGAAQKLFLAAHGYLAIQGLYFGAQGLHLAARLLDLVAQGLDLAAQGLCLAARAQNEL